MPKSQRSRGARSTSRSQQRATGRSRRANRDGAMVFTRQNYLLLGLGLVLVVVGFVIMRLDNQVESFVSLYLAPLMILGGYLEIIYAILHRPAPDVPSEAPAAAE